MQIARRPFVLALLASAAGCTKTIEAGPGDMTLGKADAPIEVVEYASVGCPVCGRWAREVYPAFKAKYVDAGKVRYVLREMSVGGGVEVSLGAAGFLLARCAGADKYFDVVEAIFQNQDAAFVDPRGTLQGIARGAGFSDEAFTKCLADEKGLRELNARVEKHGRQDGIQYTPTFIVNGKPMEHGYRTLEEIDAAISAAGRA